MPDASAFRRLAPFALLTTLLLSACPDPAATSGGTAGGPGAGPGAGPAPGAGPGAPAGEGQPGPSGPTQDWDDIDGDAVTLSGTLTYAGAKQGKVRLDFLGAGSIGGLQHTTTLDAAGAWSLKAPANLGTVHVVAFVDVAQDGPSADDPAGRTSDPVAIGATDVTGIDITISDEPQLGDLTPGGPHPGGGAEGGTPPVGGTTPPTDGSAPPAPADGSAPVDGAAPAGGPPPAGGAAPVDGAAPAGGAPPAAPAPTTPAGG